MRCSRASRQWAVEKRPVSHCFQQAEEYISGKCQNLQACVLFFPQRAFGRVTSCVLRDPSGTDINMIKYKTKTRLCLSSGQTLRSWREATVPRQSILMSVTGRLCQVWETVNKNFIINPNNEEISAADKLYYSMIQLSNNWGPWKILCQMI